VEYLQHYLEKTVQLNKFSDLQKSCWNFLWHSDRLVPFLKQTAVSTITGRFTKEQMLKETENIVKKSDKSCEEVLLKALKNDFSLNNNSSTPSNNNNNNGSSNNNSSTPSNNNNNNGSSNNNNSTPSNNNNGSSNNNSSTPSNNNNGSSNNNKNNGSSNNNNGSSNNNGAYNNGANNKDNTNKDKDKKEEEKKEKPTKLRKVFFTGAITTHRNSNNLSHDFYKRLNKN